MKSKVTREDSISLANIIGKGRRKPHPKEGESRTRGTNREVKRGKKFSRRKVREDSE